VWKSGEYEDQKEDEALVSGLGLDIHKGCDKGGPERPSVPKRSPVVETPCAL
jgi:hypothetical protein